MIADHRDRERWESYFEPCCEVCGGTIAEKSNHRDLFL